ncbi:MAG: biosynthetic arginine decarboxylase, partial [Acidobacteria bacterium]|nr:biosynthetic arginine decarboxylase [Acidobacteriota bacterium]
MQKLKIKTDTSLSKWSLEKAREVYNIREWGKGYFEINEKGNVIVMPTKEKSEYVDLRELVEDLSIRGLEPPLLLRFTGILRKRIEEIHSAFYKAIKEYEYKGKYYGVYPIKVNQSRQVVEDIVEFGSDYNFGLEAGTKAEMLIALSTLSNPKSIIICNGYKDDEYIEMALWAKKMGKQVFIVVEKPSEVDLVIKWSKSLKVKPLIGIRAKLTARGRGKWESSGGDKSKFGLFPSEIITAVEKLKEAKLESSVKLLHFHLGSQITSIQSIKEALGESTRIFIELFKMGLPMEYFDVGGGLAVDYDGSKTNFPSSANYSLEEYASDVISAVSEACNENDIPVPNVISESGRALVAYHSVLILNVLGSSKLAEEKEKIEIEEDAHELVHSMKEVLDNLSMKNFQESYHDALQIRDDSLTLFNVGILSLKDRGRIERIFWEICKKLAKVVGSLDYVPDEFENLEKFISDTYYLNFSVFQSLPDHWAVKQLFPICPIHRLKEEPTRKATLADITCDSDGKIDQFIDLHDVKHTIELHELDDKPYYLGAFLVGAYQESLGDLHNLFGDTNVIHISVTGKDRYRIERIIEGDTVKDVLSYM